MLVVMMLMSARGGIGVAGWVLRDLFCETLGRILFGRVDGHGDNNSGRE